MTYQFQKITPECQKKLRLIELKGLASQLSKSTDWEDAFQLAEFCHSYADNFIHASVPKDVLADAGCACTALMVAAMFMETVNDKGLMS
jgi:hypothetical protein